MLPVGASCAFTIDCAGDEIIKDVSFLQYGKVEVFEYDGNCTTVTQAYDSMALNYGKIFQTLGMRPLNTSVCFTANCQLGTYSVSKYNGGCVGGLDDVTLASGSFEVDTCTTATLRLHNVSHETSFKLACENHVEGDNLDGFLPVVTAKAEPVVMKLEFKLTLGGVTAADLVGSVVTALKQAVRIPMCKFGEVSSELSSCLRLAGCE